MLILFNSVRTSDNKLSKLQTSINHKVSFEWNSLPHVDENAIFHCHIVSKYDVRKAISNLKSKQFNEPGTFLSNNFLYGTDLLHCHLSILFASMINHGYAPHEF